MSESSSVLPAAQAERFEVYLASLVPGLRQPARERMARAYCLGLLAAPGRKSVEPLAGLHGAAQGTKLDQSLHHFVADARWSDEALLAAVAREVLPAVERHGPIQAWIVDDPGIAEEGLAFGGGGTAILRPAWRHRELPGGGQPILGQCDRQPAGGLAALPAAGLG